MSELESIRKSVAQRESLDSILSEVQKMKEATSTVPAAFREMVEKNPEFIEKAWKTLSTEKPNRAPKSAFFDPLSLQYALGYKDRRYNLTYETLKRIASQLSIVAAIINTRIAQIASFSMPYRTTKSLGFVVRHKEAERLTTNSERRFIQQLEAFISSCGEPGKDNPFTRVKRPKFEHYLKQIVRDTLTYDQVSTEIVPRNNGIPFEFRAVDASTIRIASPDRDSGTAFAHSVHQRNLIPGMTGPTPYRYGNMYIGQQYGRTMLPQEDTVQYVQVINGQIENVYTDKELMFGIRNPRTDIYVQGYGFGELEQLITIVTSMLNAEAFNRNFFLNGAHPKGILNFKGDNWTPDQLECVAEESLVQTNFGTFPIVRAYNLQNDKDIQFKFWNGDTYEPGTISQAGVKQLVSIGLSDGSCLRPTENHRVFVLTDTGEEERFVSDLQVGDTLLQNEFETGEKELLLKDLIQTRWEGCARGPGVAFEVDDIGEDLWEVLGWMTRDGWISRDLKIALLMYTEAKDLEVFEKHGPVLEKYGIMHKQQEKEGITWQICHKAFAEFLIHIGFVAGQNTKIPWLIFSQNLAKRRAYLRGLFSANGYVSTHGYSVAITSMFEDIIAGTQQLLNTVGISSYRMKHSNPDAKQLAVRRRELFKERVGFEQQYKMDSIVDIVQSARTPSDPVSLPLLRNLLEPYRSVLEKEGNSTQLGKAGLSVINNQKCARILSRTYWREFLATQGDQKAVKLLSYRPVRVVSIDLDLYEMTYDVSIDNQKSPKFIVNGILTHNSFRRQWIAQVAGVENTWKTPITQSEGLEWVNMQLTNQDMQFNVWLEYLLKVTCGVFLIDPAELNFDLHGGVQQTPLFESSQEWKLKASRDRGLKPLLRFIAGLINEHIIDRIDDHFVFEFIGLDELSEQEKHDMLKEQIGSYLSLNEARRTLDLPDIPGGVGEVPLNPVLLQLLQFLDGKQQREQQQAQQQQQMEQQQQMQAQAAAQGQQLDEKGNPVPPPDQQGAPQSSPADDVRAAAAQQKMQHAENKHPLELAYLRQKIINGGGQPPPESGQEDQSLEGGQQEGQLQQGPRYTDLVGKSSEMSLDQWIDQMRSRL
jgi:intein/homing endonuclease